MVNFSLPNLSGLSVTSVVFSATGSFASSSYNYFVGPIGVTYTPPTVVPEPSSLAMLGLGIAAAGLGGRGRLRWFAARG